MPFEIPNAITITDGTIIGSLEQAEPDSLDFIVLGDRKTGHISGGEVTATALNATDYIDITLSAAEVVINNVYTNIASTTVTIAAAPGSGARFDLVCARSNGTFAVVTGTASSTNPIYPALPGTDYMALYAVFVRTDLKAGNRDRLIIDKRASVGTAVIKTGATTPTGGTSGDLYYQSGARLTGQSPLWLNNGGTWVRVAEYVATSTGASANNVAQRDGSGDLYATTFRGNVVGNVTGNVTGAVTGNASTATALQTSRNITLSGDVTGSASFDGTATAAITATIASTSVENSMIDYTSVPQMTVSTASPTGGKNGDVWIQV